MTSLFSLCVAVMAYTTTPASLHSSGIRPTIDGSHGERREAVTAFIDVAVIPMDSERVLTHQTVVVRQGRILALGPLGKVRVPSNAVRIDGRGKFLIPGLADMHVHLEMVKSASLEKVLSLFVANGVTTVRDMAYVPKGAGPFVQGGEDLLRLRAQVSSGELLGPRIYTSSVWRSEGKDVAASIHAYKAAGYDFIKVHDEEPALAEHGAVLLTERMHWVERNTHEFSRVCAAIGERTPVHMRYASPLSGMQQLRDALAQALEEKRTFDIRRGVTHAGPHRDDLPLLLGSRELRVFGSAGQQRTVAIALRMLEAATFREHLGGDPLLLLDDPFAELDTRRASHILALLRDAGLGQTVLVVPRASDIPSDLTRLERWIIHDGALQAEAHVT